MKKNTIFAGLDVHKNSTDIALADACRDGDVRFYGSIGGDLDALHKVVRKFQSIGATLRFVYEAGGSMSSFQINILPIMYLKFLYCFPSSFMCKYKYKHLSEMQSHMYP